MPIISNRYSKIIEKIFQKYYKKQTSEILFSREDIINTCKELKILLPKNIGDIIYSFRYRTSLPISIEKKTPKRF